MLTTHSSCFARQKRWGNAFSTQLSMAMPGLKRHFNGCFARNEQFYKRINSANYITGVLFACSEIPLLSIHANKDIYTKTGVCIIHGLSNRFGKEDMKKPPIFVHMIFKKYNFSKECTSRILIS